MNNHPDASSAASSDSRTTRRIPQILLLLAFVFGAIASLKLVITLFAIDADSSHSLMIYDGVREHGLDWLASWRFTQDNWMLSLVPFHAVAYLVFGERTEIVIVVGWLIFVANAAMSGVIVRQLGGKRAALPVAILLVFAGSYAHIKGFTSYSTSHNVTNLFGLFSLSLLAAWSTRRRFHLLFGMFVCLVVGAVSDPWMVAAFNLPLLLAGICALFLPKSVSRSSSIGLVLVAAASIVAVRTQLFGLMSYLPQIQFVPGSPVTWDANAAYLVKDLGGLFNLIPFRSGNAFLPALLSLIGIVALYAETTRRTFDTGALRRGDRLLFLITCAFSAGGIIAAFVLSDVKADDSSSRFVINVLYLAMIGLGCMLDLTWERLPVWLRASALCGAGLFLLNGITSNASDWLRPGWQFHDSGVTSTYRFLRDNGLTYGYGSYWGSNANTVTALSRSTIRMRPVEFDPLSGAMITGSRAETSERWFTEEDLPKGRFESFVYLVSDHENCPDLGICVEGLKQQFGAPTRTLEHGAAKVLVWDRPLIGSRMRLGDIAVFNDPNAPIQSPGWSTAEPWGTWANEKRAFLVINLPGPLQHDLELTINGRGLIVDKLPRQEVVVYANGVRVGRFGFDRENPQGERRIVVPKAVADQRNGVIGLRFEFPNAASPLSMGLSKDPRLLGFGISSLTVKDLPESR